MGLKIFPKPLQMTKMNNIYFTYIQVFMSCSHDIWINQLKNIALDAIMKWWIQKLLP